MSPKNASSNKYSDEHNAAKLTQSQFNSLKLSKSKKKISCLSNRSSSKCFISIWSTWYSLLVLAIHVYLIKIHIEHILKLVKLYSSSSNSSATILILNIEETFNLRDQLFYELTSRICLLSLSFLFLVLFVFTSLKQIGNYSNDGIKFGRDFFLEKLHHNQHTQESQLLKTTTASQTPKNVQSTKLIKPVPTVQLAVIESGSLTDDTLSNISSIDESETKQNRTCKCLRSVCSSVMRLFKLTWRHFLPFNSFFHLLSILLLILPNLVYQNSTQDYLTCSNDMPQTSPCIFHLKVTNISAREIVYDTSSFFKEINEFRFELSSIILALISMYIRYGSVFWFTNKTLSFLITFIGFIGGCEQLMQLYSFRYISKQIEFRHLSKSVFDLMSVPRNDTSSLGATFRLMSKFDLNQTVYFPSSTSFNVPDEEPIYAGQLINSKFLLFSLYLLLSIFVYFSAMPCYAFAYLKYKERFLIEEALFVRSTVRKNDANEETGIGGEDEKRKLNHYVSNVDMDINRLVANLEESNAVRSDEAHSCCFNYCPHLIATIQLIVMCGCKLPFCYDYIFYFNYYKDFGIMICIIVEIIHTIILLFIWLSLTLKNDWNMHLQTSYSVCHWTYHLKLKENSLLKSSKIKSNI